MRIWSVHPQHLDRQGLIAGWREALLAQKVLTGTTRGYRNHPQLVRFHEANVAVRPALADGDPGPAIAAYLHHLADEADRRGYRFDRSRVLGAPDVRAEAIAVTDGQLRHEWEHLRAKLAVRSPDVLARWSDVVVPQVHPSFVVVPGPVAAWEVLSDRL